MIDKIFAPIKAVIDLIGKYGFLKIIASVILLVYMSAGIYIVNNPSVIFERYDKYVTNRHEKSNNFRIRNAPKITQYLNQLVVETGADRAMVFEFHNGKNNPSGLQWQYADATFISDNTDDVRDDFQNVSVVKYPLCYNLYDNCSFIGDINDVDAIDHRLALRLEINDIQAIACVMMYDEKMTEIGFIEVSYIGEPSISKREIEKITYKYASKISPLLDMAKIK